MSKPVAIQLFGPTASGKTALAITIAQAVNGAIINADSRQVYQGLPLLSAMPTPAEQAAAPHHLYEFVAPSEPFSVGDYLKAATRLAAELTAKGQVPIFVGGTGFYLQALSRGINPLPVVPRDLSMELFKRAHEVGASTLHAELAKVDAPTAKKLNPNDTQRICRALGVYEVSGAPLSYWQKADKNIGALPYNFIKVGLAPERETVLARQELRFDHIIEEGVLAEVAKFAENWPDPDRNALTTHGLREIQAHLAGEVDFEITREQIIIAMRQYAKRQMTWLRNSFKPTIVLEEPTLEPLLPVLKRRRLVAA